MKQYLKWGQSGYEWTGELRGATPFDDRQCAEAEIKAQSIEGATVEQLNNTWVITKMQTQQQPKANWNGRVKRPVGASQQQTTTPNPFQVQAQGDLADRIGQAVSNSFSPGGLIVFGGVVFGSAAILNLGFWGSVFAGMPVGQHVEKILMGDLGLLGMASAGWLLSAGTTLFQTYPIVAKKSGDSIAKQFLSSLFRPDLTKMRGGEFELADAHNKLGKDFWKFMGWAWFCCTLFEVMGGIIFMGNIFGEGLASLLSLLLFLYSIAGCQIGAFFIVMGQNMRLPKEGRGLYNRLGRTAVTEAYQSIKK